jgi:predicted TIM-barrel fold metal-dependent hydrolase
MKEKPMHAEARARIGHLTRYLESRLDSLTIDADVHPSDTRRCPPRAQPGYYHGRPVSAEDLVAEMDLAGVAMANIWQNPAATAYPGGEDENAASLLEANRYVFEAALRFPGRFIPSGWTDPQACGVGNACRIAETCIREFGFALVKMNPAQNRFPIDSPAVTAVLDRIVELGAVPAFHYGADTPYTSAAGLETVARRHPEHPLVAIHMGGGGAGYLEAEALYHQSLALGLRCPNIRFVLSTLRDVYIEEALIAYQLAGPPFSGNLFCGSDAPYGRMLWCFGGFRETLGALASGRHPDPRLRNNPSAFTEEAVRGYLGGNFARFMLENHRRLAGVEELSPARP